MDQSWTDKARKAAEDIAGRAGEAARAAGERIDQFRDAQRYSGQIRDLEAERQRCRDDMADLLIRMFNQHTFAEALLKPEYLRIREIDGEIIKLKALLAAIGHVQIPLEGEVQALPSETPAAEVAEPKHARKEK